MDERTEALARPSRQFQIELLYVFDSRAAEVREWLVGERQRLEPGPADVDVGVKVAGVLDYRWELPSPDIPATTIEFTCYPKDGVLAIP